MDNVTDRLKQVKGMSVNGHVDRKLYIADVELLLAEIDGLKKELAKAPNAKPEPAPEPKPEPKKEDNGKK